MLGLQNIKISPQILNLISEIDEFKGAWAAMENHTTSLQLLGEVSNFGRNFQEISASWRGKPLNTELLCRLHALFTGAQQVSIFKEDITPLYVEKNGEKIGVLQVATPEEVRSLMPRLMQWLENALEKRDLHPLLVIAVFTAVFLQICPFEKGNQKLAKLFIILLMFKAGYSYAPFSTLDIIVHDHAEDYYNALLYTQKTLAEGKIDWDIWLVFFLKILKIQKDKLKSRIENGGSKIANMPSLSLKVMKLFEKHDRLSMKDVERFTRGKRSTLKLRLGELVESGYLVRHGQARATWYSKI